jgi:hypothetical protein
LAVTHEFFGTPSKDTVVRLLNKLTRLKIGLTLAISTSTTKNIIEEANKRWGVNLLPDNVTICTKPNPLTPKTPDGRRNFPPLTTGTVPIRLDSREVAKELMHRQNHSHDHTRVLTDNIGSPCETSIHGATYMNDAEKGGHHILILGPEL